MRAALLWSAVLLAALAAGCASSDDATDSTNVPETSAHATTSSVVPSKAAAIAYIDAACQRFFSLDPLNPAAANTGELRAKARQRAAAIDEARRALKDVPLPIA